MEYVNSIQFSVDLATLAQWELKFLKKIASYTQLQTEAFCRRAIWRYELFWLPLASSASAASRSLPHQHQQQQLAPPLDVYWVWHCHQLAPAHYQRDCEALTGRLVEHELSDIDGDVFNQKQLAAQLIWSEMYGTAEEPFFLLEEPFQSRQGQGQGSALPPRQFPAAASSFQSRCSYDLYAAMQRQLKFYYNVSLPHYTDAAFLQSAVDRYKKYLILTKLYSSAHLVPTYDIDLIWHTHQLTTQAYHNDLAAILGYLLNHDDTDTDRSEGSKLAQSYTSTKQLWLDTFGDDYHIPGTLYRGLSSQGKLSSLPRDKMATLRARSTKVTLTTLTLQGLDMTGVMKIKIAVRLHVNGSNRLLCSLDSQTLVFENGSQTGLVTFDVDSRFRWQKLLVEVTTTKRNMFFLTSHNSFELAHEDLVFEIESAAAAASDQQQAASNKTFSLVMLTQQQQQQLNGSIGGGKSRDQQKLPRLLVTYRVQQPSELGDMYFSVDAGVFTTIPVPDSLHQLWGPIPLDKKPAGFDDAVCAVASHRVLDYMGRPQFTCRILHSVSLSLSAVQVFHGDKMLALSHLIGSEQLPTESQLINQPPHVMPTAEVNKRGRAFLIKDASGDWAVMTSLWAGVRPGASVNLGNGQTVRLVPGHPGYLEGHLFRLRNRSDEIDGFQVKVVRDELTTVSFSDVTVNVKSGEMIVHVTGSKGLAHVQEAETDFGESEVAQYLCSAFTLAVSHLLCQPHGRPLASPATGPAAALCMDDYVSSYSLIASAGLNCRQVPHYQSTVDYSSSSSNTSSYTINGGAACSVWEHPTLAEAASSGCGGCTSGYQDDDDYWQGGPGLVSRQSSGGGSSTCGDLDALTVREGGGGGGYIDPAEGRSYYAGTVVSTWWGSGGCSS